MIASKIRLWPSSCDDVPINYCRTDMYVRITIPASVYQSNFSAKRISLHSYQSIRIFLQSGATYFCSITILAKHDRPTRATEAFRGSLPPSRASTHKPEETGLIKNMLSALTSKSKRASKNISEFPSRGEPLLKWLSKVPSCSERSWRDQKTLLRDQASKIYLGYS